MKNQTLYRLLLCGILLLLSVSPVSGASEQELIQILQSSASDMDRCAACRELRLVGTDRSVPALAALLDKEHVGHAARYALEGMASPAADAALREGLSHTSGPLQMGLVDSLGWRRDTAAVPLLEPLLEHSDPELAISAALALGRIGDEQAVVALTKTSSHMPPTVQQAQWEALLLCAEQRLISGDTTVAATLYRRVFQAPTPPALHAAAWRGWVLSDSDQRATLMVQALVETQGPLHLAALTLVQELQDPRVTGACMAQWDTLDARAQVAVLQAHAPFDAEARTAIHRAAASPHASVRTAAWQALAQWADPARIPVLARAAAQGDTQEQMAARMSLARMHGPGVRKALLRTLEKADAPAQAELLRALGARHDRESAAVLLQYAETGPQPVRRAALTALRQLALLETLAPLLNLTVTAPSTADRSEVLKALYAICRTHPEKEEIGCQVLATMERLPQSNRRYILPLLAELATPATLQVVQTASQDADSQLAREAIRVMGQWPTAAPVPHLLELARSAAPVALRTLALRAGITVIGREEDPDKRLDLLKEALPLAQRTEEKRLALSQLGRIPLGAALELTLPFLHDPALTGEASLAALSIAESLAASHPLLADQAAQQVLACCEVSAVVKRAWALRVKPAAGGPFIRNWLVCGPYRQAGATGALTVFNLAFGPEKGDDHVLWYAAPPGDTIPLAAFFPGQDNCVAYLKAELSVPRATEAILLMGSDDGLKAWLNGQEVHSNNIDRGQIADQDMAPVTLKQGANELLLKVSQGGGGWSACARIVGTDGHALADLQVKNQSDAAAPVSAYTPAPEVPVVPQTAQLPARDNFRTLCLSDQFYAEGAYYGDFNRDGVPDVVAGPFWFAGPDFQQRHAYRPPQSFDPKGYSDNFLTFTGDFNADGWIDILCVPWPGKEGYWYANPGDKPGHWQPHLAYPFIGNESQVWGDVTDDGRPELLFCTEGYLGYAVPDLSNPTAPWTYHAISTEDKRYQRYTHGIGFGDINGDGRTDVVEAVGWWEHLSDSARNRPWAFHPFPFAEAAAQILVYDVDGDGLSDVITAWHCHHYGLVWWKQLRRADGRTDWQRQVILSPTPDVTTTDFRPSQLHAFELVDMNGDGLKDILTGKRFWAHGPTGDKEPDAPAVVFWLELQRDNSGQARFVPHLIDDDSGVGTQVAAADLNNDERPDVIVANKKGIFVHLSQQDK